MPWSCQRVRMLKSLREGYTKTVKANLASWPNDLLGRAVEEPMPSTVQALSYRSFLTFFTISIIAIGREPNTIAEEKAVWRDLRFGMTLTEAVDALGPLVKRHPTAAEQEAAAQRATLPINVEAVIESALECKRREEEAGRQVPNEVSDALAVLRAAAKTRTWVSDKWDHANGDRTPVRLAGKLKTIELYSIIPRITVLLGNKRLATVGPGSLDPKSFAFVESVRSAASVTDAFRQALADREFQPDDSARITSMNQFSLESVDVEGVSFQPALRFTPELSSIVLRADGAKLTSDLFDRLTEKMRKSHGQEAEAVKSAQGHHRIWRGKDMTVVLAQAVREVNVPVFSQAAGRAYGYTAASTVTSSTLSIDYITPELGSAGDRLRTGESLSAGQGLRSRSGQYVLQLLEKGDLVLYHNGVQSPIWTAQTDGTPAATLNLSDDGDLALLDTNGKVIWNTQTSGRGGEFLCLQDDGNLVLNTSDQGPAWATNTNR